MARIKGLALRARLDFLETKFGREGLLKVLETLPPRQREVLAHGVLISSWYPLELSDALLGGAERVHGRSDGALCQEIGAASGRKGLTTVYRVFTSNSQSEAIGEQMAKTTALVWQTYYDTGRFSTCVLGENSIRSELTGMKLEAPWLCHILLGYQAAHIEVLGGCKVVVTHPECTLRGDNSCAWVSRWELPSS
jgi:hypothetical protein